MYLFLLIVGIALVVASFVLPERFDKSEGTTKLVQEGLSELLEREMDKIKENTDDVASEAAKLAAMKAVQEVTQYSDNIMRDMQRIKEHVDAVQDETDVKCANLETQTNVKVEELKKTLEKKAEELSDSMEKKAGYMENTMADSAERYVQGTSSAQPTGNAAGLSPVQIQTNGTDAAEEGQETSERDRDSFSFFTKPTKKVLQSVEENVANARNVLSEKVQKLNASVPVEEKNEDETVRGGLSEEDFIDLGLETDADKAKKSLNEKIWELHEQGKSKMVIASELGIGLAEVRNAVQMYKELHE